MASKPLNLKSIKKEIVEQLILLQYKNVHSIFIDFFTGLREETEYE